MTYPDRSRLSQNSGNRESGTGVSGDWGLALETTCSTSGGVALLHSGIPSDGGFPATSAPATDLSGTDLSGTDSQREGLAGVHVVASHGLGAGQRSAQGLIPAARDMLREHGLSPRDLSWIAVAGGPGSFTGLRVGLSVAKLVGYSTGAAVVAVGTLEAIAFQALGSAVVRPESAAGVRIAGAIDAQRGECFVQEFEVEAGGVRAVSGIRILKREVMFAEVDADSIWTGPGLRRVDGEALAVGRVTEESCWDPLPETIGRLGFAGWRAGETVSVFELRPVYARASAAEEKRRASG